MPDAFFRFPRPLREGRIVSRPNRFIILVRAGGKTLRCHCPTTGRLGNLELSGLPCLYSKASNGTRKTGYTVEAISTSLGGRAWVGINQTAANRYLEFFLRKNALTGIASGTIQREVKLGRSRIDFLIGDTYVEVKTPLIMLPASGGAGYVKRSPFNSFDRLIKHMEELSDSIAKGAKGKLVLCFLYDAKPFKPPPPDRTNAKILAAARAAEEAGLERWQVNLRLTRKGVSLIRYFRSSTASESSKGRSIGVLTSAS